MSLTCIALLTPSIVEGVGDYQRGADIKADAYASRFVLYGAELGQFAQLPEEILGRPGAVVLNEKEQELGCIQADSKTIGVCRWWHKETDEKSTVEPARSNEEKPTIPDQEAIPAQQPEKLHGLNLFES
jgi:hypothetical protein